MRRSFRHKTRRGVTLLEMLVAAALLAVGLLGALEAIARCSASTRGVEDRTRALMFARSKIEEILKEPVLQVGQDQGQGVDTTTDYDWFASIEQSQNPSLYVVRVRAVNRITTNSAEVSALRRPDLDTAPDGTSITEGATGTGTGTGTGAGAGAGGSSL